MLLSRAKPRAGPRARGDAVGDLRPIAVTRKKAAEALGMSLNSFVRYVQDDVKVTPRRLDGDAVSANPTPATLGQLSSRSRAPRRRPRRLSSTQRKHGGRLRR